MKHLIARRALLSLLAPVTLFVLMATSGCSQPPVEKLPEVPAGMVSADSIALAPGTTLYDIKGNPLCTVVRVDEAHAFENGVYARGLEVTYPDKPGVKEWKKSLDVTLNAYVKSK